MAVVETEGLTKRLGDVTLLDQVALQIETGDAYGLLGPTGSGKSTLVNILLDFVRPTAGSVRVLGTDPQTDPRQVKQEMGVLFEDRQLHRKLTAREHLFSAGLANEYDVDVSSLLERVGLPAEAADQKLREFTEMMDIRLAFGMALIGEPELLVLDSPLAGLDPAEKDQMRTMIERENTDQRTLLLVSNDPATVERLCDRVGIIQDGSLVFEEKIATVHSRLSLGTSMTVEVTQPPSRPTVAAIDGVEDVTIDETTIDVELTDTSMKATVVQKLSNHTDILDIRPERNPLEELVTRYSDSAIPEPTEHGDRTERTETTDRDTASTKNR